MTVRMADDGAILLEGECPIDDADRLLELRTVHPESIVDWRACTHAHSAVIQLLLIGRPAVLGPPSADFLRQMIQPLVKALPA